MSSYLCTVNTWLALAPPAHVHHAAAREWLDAYLGAFALAEGCRLVTTDHAFRQVDELDPLVLG